jgi:hypothetical protein
MLPFNKPCRRHVRALAHNIETGGAVPKIQRQEADLYINPRRVR